MTCHYASDSPLQLTSVSLTAYCSVDRWSSKIYSQPEIKSIYNKKNPENYKVIGKFPYYTPKNHEHNNAIGPLPSRL